MRRDEQVEIKKKRKIRRKYEQFKYKNRSIGKGRIYCSTRRKRRVKKRKIRRDEQVEIKKKRIRRK